MSVCAENSTELRKVERTAKVCAENSPKLRKVERTARVCAENGTELHKVDGATGSDGSRADGAPTAI